MKRIMLLAVVMFLLVGGNCWAKELIDVEKLADSIKIAEGSYNHPYGILRDYCLPGDTNGQCRKGCIQTINKRYRMWDGKGDFIDYLQRSYCPIGASNDPKGLNRNWSKNVKANYYK